VKIWERIKWYVKVNQHKLKHVEDQAIEVKRNRTCFEMFQKAQHRHVFQARDVKYALNGRQPIILHFCNFPFQ